MAPPGKRGPKTALSDEQLIWTDLAASPFQGEGHRKVWARLRVRDGVKVGRRRGHPNPHQGEIITPAPNRMWGTDGAKIFTVEEGWGWLFVAVEHWNAECVGRHVCKQGTRFAALEPVSQGLMATVGSVTADTGRGLSLRMDHGTQYLVGSFPESVETLGHKPQLRRYRTTTDQRPDISEPAGGARRGQALHGDLQPGAAGGKKRLSKPMAGPSQLASTELCRGCLKNSCPEKRMRYSDHSRVVNSVIEHSVLLAGVTLSQVGRLEDSIMGRNPG